MLVRVAICFSLLVLSVPDTMASPTSSFVDKIIFAESSGNPQARPCDPETGEPLSSAFGAGQFIEATWLEMVRKHRPDLAAKSDDQILELRSDFALSREMTIKFTEENRNYLTKNGAIPTHAALYLAHFAGARGAATLLSAHRDTPVEDILSPQAVEANGFLKGKTVAALYAWAKAKMNVEVPPASLQKAAASGAGAMARDASPACGSDTPAARVAEVSREKPANPLPAERPHEVRLIQGGVVQVAATD